ncbi:MAG TPA: radical SAM protein [Myxococcales bacterium]|jgi:radical SAM protein with 4Fe4S-binding SPASM domain
MPTPRNTLAPLAVPEVVGWETTLRCNMRCRHCGSTAGAARKQELSRREALALCRQFADLGIGRVVLTGGETLLRTDWQDILQALFASGIQVGLLTNGWALNARVVKQLAKIADGGFHVAVSIDGTREVHDDIRCLKGSFDRALSGAKMVKAAGIPAAIITTVSHANLHTLPELGEILLRELEPYCWQIQITTPFGRAREHGDLNLSPVEYAQVATFVSRFRRKVKGTPMQVYPGDCLGYLSSIESGMRGEDSWQGCQAGLRLAGIQSNGNVKACLSIIDDAFIEGNVLEEGLERIWNRPGAFAFTRQFKKSKLRGDCRTCTVAEVCRGGCSASSISVHGQAGQAPYCLRAVEDRAAKSPKRRGKARPRQLKRGSKR